MRKKTVGSGVWRTFSILLKHLLARQKRIFKPQISEFVTINAKACELNIRKSSKRFVCIKILWYV
jgi:hypothetical protein